MRECGPEISGRLPDRVIQIGRAFADRAVKLGGDEAWLMLHERRIVLPCFEKGLLIRFVEREHAEQHHGAGIDRDLTFDRENGVEGAQQRHETLLSIWLYVVDLA